MFKLSLSDIVFFFFKDYILNFINLNSEINTNIFWFNNTISSHLYIRERERKKINVDEEDMVELKEENESKN